MKIKNTVSKQVKPTTKSPKRRIVVATADGLVQVISDVPKSAKEYVAIHKEVLYG